MLRSVPAVAALFLLGACSGQASVPGAVKNAQAPHPVDAAHEDQAFALVRRCALEDVIILKDAKGYLGVVFHGSMTGVVWRAKNADDICH